MIFDIAIGFVFGVLLLVALVILVYCIFVVINKGSTIKHTTIKKYDFEEEDDDEFDEYN